MKRVKKVKVLISFILICLVSLGLMFTFVPVGAKVYAEGQEEGLEYTLISSLSEITNSVGKYQLDGDITITSEKIADEFCGELDGNGYSFIVQSLSSPIFDKIGAGAIIKNLSIKSNSEESAVTFTCGTNDANFGGVLAKEIVGAQISNVQVLRCQVDIKDDVLQNSLNVGVLAGKISESKISQVQIKNAVIKTFEDELVPGSEDYLSSNSNIGFIAGSVTSSEITNCLLENVEMSYKFSNVVSPELNFGGMAGMAENSTFANNIINLYQGNELAVIPTIVLRSGYSETIYFGGLIGKLLFGEKTKIYNNVVLLHLQSFYCDNSLTLIAGSVVGNLFYEPDEPYIKGFLTNYDSNYFGTLAIHDYALLRTQPYENISCGLLRNNENWYSERPWNFETVWTGLNNAKSPSLQTFLTYNVYFDEEDSKNSLTLEVPPQDDVVDSAFTNQNAFPDFEEDAVNQLTDIKFGETVKLKVAIKESNFYKNFFLVSKLIINDIEAYDNLTQKSAEGFNITCEIDEDGNYVYTLNNFNANLSGNYFVKLMSKTYYLNVKVLDLSTEEGVSNIPGAFKTNRNTNAVSQQVISFSYGDEYIINTSVTNMDYSDKAYWYIFKNDSKNALGELETFNNSENYEIANLHSNTMGWRFTEKPSENKLLNPDPDDAANSKTYFNIQDYKEVELEDKTITSNYELIIVYVKQVKQVKIVLKYEGDKGEQIKTQVATLLINNKSDRLTWNEEEGVYYAKVPFYEGEETTYTIKIDEMQSGMQFLEWSYGNVKLGDVVGELYAGEFVVSDDDDSLEIYCIFVNNLGGARSNLLWLWITLSAIGVILLAVVIILIIKRKRATGGKSYKKYYY